MYRCLPDNGDPAHRFRPVLSRLVVDHGETCSECSSLRGVNKGDTTAARGHKFTTRIVAASLERLAAGDSYGSVAGWALTQMEAQHTHAVVTPIAARHTPAKARQNAWRLTADWVETFSPTLWDAWSSEARAEVIEALGGPVKDRPVVSLLLDDIPIFARSNRGVRGRQRFSVLAASESFLDRDRGTRVTRLRLLRAYPDHSAEAYKLVLAELGYVPDIVMADGGKGIGGAVRWLEKTNPSRPFLTCLSAYHLRSQLQRQFTKTAKPLGFEPGDLIERLENWSFASSGVAWRAWWSDYETRMRAQGIPESVWPTRWIKEVKPKVDMQMDVLDDEHVLPRSTGSLEATLFKVVKPSLTGRAQGFGNLTRTNRLLDLMVLRANGYFDNLSHVTGQLSADALQHDGFAPVVRSIVDERMTRSLLDEEAPERLVRELGL